MISSPAWPRTPKAQSEAETEEHQRLLASFEWSWSIAAGLPHRGTTGLLDAGAAVGALECDDKTPYHRGEHAYDDGLTRCLPPRPLPWAALLPPHACERLDSQLADARLGRAAIVCVRRRPALASPGESERQHLAGRDAFLVQGGSAMTG